LVPFPLLQHKLRVLIKALRRNPTADKIVSLAIACYALFHLNKNISIVYKKTTKGYASQEHPNPSLVWHSTAG
jgi:hypothetical protein